MNRTEYRQIIAKVDQLMALLEELEAQLAASRSTDKWTSRSK